jgi:hypothetical protein
MAQYHSRKKEEGIGENICLVVQKEDIKKKAEPTQVGNLQEVAGNRVKRTGREAMTS